MKKKKSFKQAIKEAFHPVDLAPEEPIQPPEPFQYIGLTPVPPKKEYFDDAFNRFQGIKKDVLYSALINIQLLRDLEQDLTLVKYNINDVETSFLYSQIENCVSLLKSLK
jgi:hypothetical protein